MSDGLPRTEALVNALYETIRDPSAEARASGDIRLYLEQLGLVPEDAEALAALPQKRLLLYRRLVRRGLSAAIRAQLPLSARALGPLFEAYTARFCSDALPASPYLRDVAFAFTAWALPLWKADPQIPAYLIDLAHHELVYFELSAFPEPPGQPTGKAPDLERPLAFQTGARLCRYAFAVHLLEADAVETAPFEQVPTALLAYRDAALDAHFLELSPLAAAMAERLFDGQTLGQAILGSCAAIGLAPDAAILDETAEMLADWSSRGIVLGGI